MNDVAPDTVILNVTILRAEVQDFFIWHRYWDILEGYFGGDFGDKRYINSMLLELKRVCG